MNDDKLNHKPDNVYSSSGVQISGDVNTGGGDFIGRDQVIHGYSSEQVSELLEQIRKRFQPKPFDGRSPYVGLDSFQEEDVDRFFGRDKLVDELLERLTTSQFVMLTGPSGSGKSSVIQAGLIPKLRKGIIQGSDRWLYATLRPGRDPLASLGRAMAGLVGKSSVVKEFKEQGQENYSLLADWTDIALVDNSKNHILLVIDQFEEIFTQLSDKEEPIRLAFLQQIENAYTVETNKTIFLLAMRSDFIGQCAAYPGLNALINQQFLQVGAMSQDELVSAIARPALEVGLRIDPDLVAQVLSDMRDQSGSLPLMQFAMADLFHAEKESGGVVALTLERYMALGGLSHALQRHADAAFARLSPSEQELARRVFEGLVQPGFGTVDTARTARFNELEKQGINPQEVNSVVHKLADARLVTTDESTDDEPTVRLVHERLLEAWPWLTRLVSENREAISIQNEIQQDALLWERNEYDESYLYSGARLETARERLEEERIHLNETAASFLEAGVHRKLAEEIKKQEEQRKKIEDAQRLAEEQRARADEQAAATIRIRRRAMVVTAVAVIAVVFAILAGIFYFQSQERSAIARTRLAVLASTLHEIEQDLAILLSIEAYPLVNLSQTSQVLQSPNNVSTIAWSPDRRLASGSDDGTIIVWDLKSKEPEIILEGNSIPISSLAWLSVGQLASGLIDGTIIVWDLERGQPDVTLEGHSWRVSRITWSASGQLASADGDGVIIVWDLESGQPKESLQYLKFLPVIDRLRLFSGGLTGNQTLRSENSIVGLDWSSDGKLVSSSLSGLVTLWDPESGGEEFLWDSWEESTEVNSEYKLVYTMASSPDVKLAMANFDGSITLLDPGYDQQEVILKGHSNIVSSVAWSPDGRLASGSLDGTVIVWDLESGEPDDILEVHTSRVSSVGWSSSDQLASGSYDGTIIIWNPDLSQVDPESWISQECQRAGRNLTQEEWDLYFPGETYRKTCEQWPLGTEQ